MMVQYDLTGPMARGARAPRPPWPAHGLSRNDAVGLGGTANLAVPGGNLPPGRTHEPRSRFRGVFVRTAVGRVARQNGPVARSTRNPTATPRLRNPQLWHGLVLWLLLCVTVSAHQPGLSYLNLVATPTHLTGRLDLSLRDIEFAIGLDEDDNGSVTYEELLNRQPAIGDYVLQRLRLQADAEPLDLRVTNHKVAADQDGVFAVVELEAPWPRPPRQLDVAFSLFFDYDPNHRGLLQLEFEGEPRVAVFRIGEMQQSFELAKPPPPGEQIRQFLWEGTWHIWIGYDHILFLLALLLPSVLKRGEQGWEGVDRFRPAFINVVKIVTAFTIAHSITLSLAVLELVTLRGRIVEPLIAVSVALAAANNIRPVVREGTWLVAFVFGIIHGFGFASVLGTLGLPPKALALALVSFNVGVELGQLAIVAVFLPAAFRVRAWPLYHRHTLRWGSAAIAALACWWLVERVTG
jgi:hypothetical protein